MSVDSDKNSREITEEVLAGGELVIDLSDPPTREDLGVPEGRKTFILEREAFEQFDVTLRFTDGKELRTPATFLSVETDGSDDPTSLVIGRNEMSLDQLRTALESAVTDVGADQGQVSTFLELAPSATEGEANLVRSIPTQVAPPDSLSVQPIVTAAKGRVSINYNVGWGDQ